MSEPVRPRFNRFRRWFNHMAGRDIHPFRTNPPPQTSAFRILDPFDHPFDRETE